MGFNSAFKGLSVEGEPCPQYMSVVRCPLFHYCTHACHNAEAKEKVLCMVADDNIPDFSLSLLLNYTPTSLYSVSTSSEYLTAVRIITSVEGQLQWC
jgi:hypothetical protein